VTNNIKAHTALILANVLYGINYVIAKAIMPEYITPEALIFLRVVPSAILFWIIGLMVVHEPQEKPDYKKLFIAAFFGVFLNQFLFIKGLSFSSPIDAAIIITSNPILVLVVAAIILRERITNIKILGIVIGACGALVLVGGNGLQSFSTEHLFGNLLLLLNSVSFAMYMVFAKPLMQKYHAVHVLKWIFLFGTLLYVPFGIKSFMQVNWHAMTLPVIGALFYIVLATTVLTYFLINYSLGHLRSTTVSIYIYVQPVVTTITAIIAGMDTLDWINMTASTMVFSGVYLVSRDKKRK
jgi:drug/metabolite transporter (DMT)-like permease